jgi:hypothetical protein
MVSEKMAEKMGENGVREKMVSVHISTLKLNGHRFLYLGPAKEDMP